MKKVLIPVLIGLASFALGAAGFFVAMPSLAPARVNEAKIHLDSLARADSLAQLELLAQADGELIDSTALDTLSMPVDSTGAALAVSTDALPEGGAPAADASRLAAENAALKSQLQQADARKSNTPAVDAAALSGTLGKLGDKELRAILQQLDPSVLTVLYTNSSSKNQTRLLEAMPPDRAAAFVQSLVTGSAPAKPAGAVPAENAAMR